MILISNNISGKISLSENRWLCEDCQFREGARLKQDNHWILCWWESQNKHNYGASNHPNAKEHANAKLADDTGQQQYKNW